MYKWFKKHFIPHTGNKHRPHILRQSGARRVIGIILAVELLVFVLPAMTNMNVFPGLAAILPTVLGELTNEERQALKLPTLTVNPLLTEAAKMKALDMAMKGYFAHTSPEGRTPWYWIELAGYKYQYAGENLAVNFKDSEDVTAAWLRSPTHKANIMKGAYTEMGTGIARGTYKGRNSIFVAQVYANPLPDRGGSIQGQVTSETETIQGGVLGVQAENLIPKSPNFWQRLLASPRNTTNVLLSAIFVIMAMALVLYTFIRVRGHERDLIGNGLAVLAIIGAILAANYYASWNTMIIEQSYDYALEDTSI